MRNLPFDQYLTHEKASPFQNLSNALTSSGDKTIGRKADGDGKVKWDENDCDCEWQSPSLSILYTMFVDVK